MLLNTPPLLHPIVRQSYFMFLRIRGSLSHTGILIDLAVYINSFALLMCIPWISNERRFRHFNNGKKMKIQFYNL